MIHMADTIILGSPKDHLDLGVWNVGLFGSKKFSEERIE
jgi:hypothetical protein